MNMELERNYTVCRRPIGSRVWTTEGGARDSVGRAISKARDVQRQYPDSDVAITCCELPKEPSTNKETQLFRMYEN